MAKWRVQISRPASRAGKILEWRWDLQRRYWNLFFPMWLTEEYGYAGADDIAWRNAKRAFEVIRVEKASLQVREIGL